ncbi:hypothetical protein [Fictibacillus macauensis]|uniref:hypothetical protein n=1 Tax=Fictibacillus macauensis TaxID=245160 RepID=UPI0003100533|nr:hypothetical protein [Fictibacillus macauensis]
MDFRKFLTGMYCLQVACLITGSYLLLVYIYLQNTERIMMLTYVLLVNFFSLAVTKRRYK